MCRSAARLSPSLSAKNEPRWHPVAKQMVHAWNEGMASVRDPKKSLTLRGLDAAIEAAGFSEPEPPEPHRVTIGRSELLATRQNKK